MGRAVERSGDHGIDEDFGRTPGAGELTQRLAIVLSDEVHHRRGEALTARQARVRALVIVEHLHVSLIQPFRNGAQILRVLFPGFWLSVDHDNQTISKVSPLVNP